ncbi:oligosaccharide flippase family protein [bacterium]|nr:oligosaccharide flippase family protein [bacterium]MBU1636459.1 oligosaccharide flippase family protein [bacterium]
MNNTETQSRSGGTFAYLVGNIIEGAFALLFSIILVRLISQHDFGSWRQFLIVFGLASNILIFGLPKSLLYFYSISEKLERSRIALRSLLLTVGLGALAAIVYLIARGLIAHAWSSPALSTYAGLFALYLFLYFPLNIFQPLLLANDNRFSLAIWKAAFATTKLLVLVYVLVAGGTLLNLLIAINIHTLLQLLISLVIYIRISGWNLSNLWEGLDEQLRYSSHVTSLAITGSIAREADKILVSSSFSPDQFAAYSVGARELPLINLFPYAISDAIAPDLSRLHRDSKFSEFLHLWHSWMQRIAMIMFPLFALIIFKYEEIITLLYTEDYIAGAIPFLIFGILIPLRITSFVQVLLSMNSSRAVAIGSAINLTIVAIVGFIALKTIGFIGPALAVVASEYIVNGFYCARIRKLLNIHWLKLFPLVFLGKALALSFIAAGLATFIEVFTCDCSVFVRLLMYGSVFSMLYLLGIRILKLISSEDITRIKNIILGR